MAMALGSPLQKYNTIVHLEQTSLDFHEFGSGSLYIGFTVHYNTKDLTLIACDISM